MFDKPTFRRYLSNIYRLRQSEKKNCDLFNLVYFKRAIVKRLIKTDLGNG